MCDGIERAFDHWQERDLKRHAATLKLSDDVEHVFAGSLDDACDVLGAISVVLFPLGDEWIVEILHGVSGTYAIPNICGWRVGGNLGHHADQRCVGRECGECGRP